MSEDMIQLLKLFKHFQAVCLFLISAFYFILNRQNVCNMMLGMFEGFRITNDREKILLFTVLPEKKSTTICRMCLRQVVSAAFLSLSRRLLSLLNACVQHWNEKKNIYLHWNSIFQQLWTFFLINLNYFNNFFLFSRTNKMETDVNTKTKPQAAVIDTKNIPTIKIETAKDVEKQPKADDAEKSQKSRLCKALPVVLFLVTFATVLTVLITYMDPTSK